MQTISCKKINLEVLSAKWSYRSGQNDGGGMNSP